MTAPVDAPLQLSPNFVERFYRASGRMASFRGVPGGEFDSEEWIGSTTTVFGGELGDGLTELPDGTTLRARIHSDPVVALGQAHVARFGSNPELLLKILDAGQRLPVHVHPSRSFAHAHLGSYHGKTEAWVILQAPTDAAVYVGFRRPVSRAELLELMRSQDSVAMLEAMHRVPVEAGDTVLVPAGLPHAIGEGLLLAELQEPSDYSMMIEWEGYALDPVATGRLGLSLDEAVDCVNTSALTADTVASLRGTVRGKAGASVLSPLADEYFRAEAIAPGMVLDAGYSIVLGLSGEFLLTHEDGGAGPARVSVLRKGETLLLPHSIGAVRVEGDGRALRFRPPAPETSILYTAVSAANA